VLGLGRPALTQTARQQLEQRRYRLLGCSSWGRVMVEREYWIELLEVWEPARRICYLKRGRKRMAL